MFRLTASSWARGTRACRPWPPSPSSPFHLPILSLSSPRHARPLRGHCPHAWHCVLGSSSHRPCPHSSGWRCCGRDRRCRQWFELEPCKDLLVIAREKKNALRPPCACLPRLTVLSLSLTPSSYAVVVLLSSPPPSLFWSCRPSPRCCCSFVVIVLLPVIALFFAVAVVVSVILVSPCHCRPRPRPRHFPCCRVRVSLSPFRGRPSPGPSARGGGGGAG